MNLQVLLRWSARLTGLATFLFVGSFVVGEGLMGDGLPPLSVPAGLFSIAWLGLLLIWPWELVGGLLVAGGMAAFCAHNVVATGNLPGVWFFVWAVPGLLALASWAAGRLERRTGKVAA